jgi:FixJ family two-component response regulator
MHIYIVDDDLSVRKGMMRLFDAAGYQVSAFDSADDLLEKEQQEICGCVILDTRMPGLPALEMVSRLRDKDSQMSIIVVSGDDDPATRLIAKEIGAVGFFRKPVDGNALLDAVRWALKSGKYNTNNTSF